MGKRQRLTTLRRCPLCARLSHPCCSATLFPARQPSSSFLSCDAPLAIASSLSIPTRLSATHCLSAYSASSILELFSLFLTKAAFHRVNYPMHHYSLRQQNLRCGYSIYSSRYPPNTRLSVRHGRSTSSLLAVTFTTFYLNKCIRKGGEGAKLPPLPTWMRLLHTRYETAKCAAVGAAVPPFTACTRLPYLHQIAADPTTGCSTQLELAPQFYS